MLHGITCWLLVAKLGWAETGAALATNLTYFLNLVICELLMLRNAKIRLTYRLPNKSMFKNIWHYLSIGVPGAMMLCFEWWAFELLALLSGLISVEAQAAEIVVINMASFFFMVPLGTSYAASALTGFFLGEGKINQAKKYGHLTLVFSTIITIAIVVLLGCFDISKLFT
jgi:MATE family multidrug resistance protein